MIKPPLSSINVNKDGYLFNHGKYPKGYGSWAFEVKGETYWFTGLFSVCATEAKKVARDKGTYSVKVLP